MVNQDEQVYIRRVCEGDPSAYAVLVDKYKVLAYSIALKVLGNEEEAQDVAQEGFIKAYQQLHQFEGKSKFSTWLYTIVYRTAISKKKEARIRTFSIPDHVRDNFSNDHTTPQLIQMQSDDVQKIVRQSIENLQEPDGLLVMLYYIHENTIREIQQITGLSGANIKIRLFRARKKLEKELRFLL